MTRSDDLCFYPKTGPPDRDPPGGLDAWNAIPGARGCTPQACAYRDLASALRSPTFPIAGGTFIKRLTLVGSGRRIERCFYAVFPSDADAENVLRWLTRHP